MGGRVAFAGAAVLLALAAWRATRPAFSMADDHAASMHLATERPAVRGPDGATEAARASRTPITPALLSAVAEHAENDAMSAPVRRGPGESTSGPREPADEDIDRAHALIAGGEHAAAEALLRRSWESPRHRAQAAADLWSMYRRPGFAIKADSQQVVDLLRVLGPGFRRHETPGFVVLSDGSSRWVEERAGQLERARSDFFRVMKKMGVPARPHARKLVCVLFDDPEGYRRFAREVDGVTAEWVAGYYASGANRVVSYNDARDPAIERARVQAEAVLARVAKWRSDAHEAERRSDAAGAARLRSAADEAEAQVKRTTRSMDAAARASASAKLVHEAVHLLAYNTGAQRPGREYPFWLTEGLATSFEGGAAGGGATGPDRTAGLESRRRTVRELASAGRLTPVTALVAARGAMAWSTDEAEAMYAQSAALFRVLYRRDPATLGRYLVSLGDAEARPTAEDHLARFVEAFGDPSAIDLATER